MVEVAGRATIGSPSATVPRCILRSRRPTEITNESIVAAAVRRAASAVATLFGGTRQPGQRGLETASSPTVRLKWYIAVPAFRNVNDHEIYIQ